MITLEHATRMVAAELSGIMPEGLLPVYKTIGPKNGWPWEIVVFSVDFAPQDFTMSSPDLAIRMAASWAKKMASEIREYEALYPLHTLQFFKLRLPTRAKAARATCGGVSVRAYKYYDINWDMVKISWSAGVQLIPNSM